MADNVTLDPGVGGAVIRTDDDGTAQWPYTKLAFGPDNTQTIVSTSNPLPVDIRLDNLPGNMDVNIAAAGITLPISHSSLDVVGGGTEATALRVTLANDSTGVISVDDNGGSLTVDGTVAVSGTVDTELPSAAALADNAGNPTAPAVGAFGMVWDGAAWDRAPGTSADGLLVNLGSNNDVSVSSLPSLPAGTNNIGDVDVLTLPNVTLAANSGVDIGDVDVTSVTPGTGATNLGKARSSTAGATDTGMTPLAIRDDTLGTLTDTDGEYTALRTNNRGAMWVEHDGDITVATLPAGDNNIGNVDVVTLPALPAGTNNIGDVDVLTLPSLPAGANNIGDVGVVSLPALPAGTNNIGDVDVLTLPSLPAGTNNIGDVDVLTLPAVAGAAAHDAAISGNPVPIAARANLNEPSEADAGDSSYLWADLFGRLTVLTGHANPEAPDQTDLTASGDTTVIAAPGAGVSLHVCKGSIHNSGSSAIVVQLRDGTAGTVRWEAELAPNGGGSIFDFGSRGWKLTANTLLAANLSAAGTVSCNVTEYYIAA